MTTNALVPEREIGQGLLTAAGIGGLIGGIAGAGAYGIGRLIERSLRGLSTYGLPPEFQPAGVTGQWQAWSDADIARFSTIQGASDEFVLGHFRPPAGPNYIQRARTWDASFFDPPSYIRNSLNEQRLWNVNAEALRQAVSRGETIRVGTKIDWRRRQSWLFRKMDLLYSEFDLVMVGDTFFSNR